MLTSLRSITFRVANLCIASLGLLAMNASHAVIEGEPDGKRHPFVGLIVYQLEVGGPWYAPQGGNAVLVSPRVAVTAGHVLETPLTVVQFGVRPANIGVTFRAQPVDLSMPPDLGTHWRKIPASIVHVVKSVAWHPEMFASPDAPNDVGVMIFNKPVKGVPLARIPQPGLFDLIEKVIEPRITIVGYGGTQPIFPPPFGGGNRTSGSAPLVDLTPGVAVTGMLNEGDVNGGPGDSGAPALIGHHWLVGVLSGVSFAPAPGEPSYTTFSRTDSVSACRFLKKYLKSKCGRLPY